MVTIGRYSLSATPGQNRVSRADHEKSTDDSNSSRPTSCLSDRRQCLPTPNTHRVLGFELMTQIAREEADLTSMMCIVLDEIREHVDSAARHSFHSGLTSRKRSVEQACETLHRLM